MTDYIIETKGLSVFYGRHQGIKLKESRNGIPTYLLKNATAFPASSSMTNSRW